MALITKPQYPNVPKLPGVPQLVRSANQIITGPVVGTAAAIGALWRALFVTNVWGIFKQRPPVEEGEDGIQTVTVVAKQTPVVDCDSILDFGYRNEWDVPSYPVQDGTFASYNRVSLAYEASVRLSKGGSEADRRKFLDQIETILNSSQLYQIVTPERTYMNVNPVRTEQVRRGASGAYFLTEIDLYFVEVRTATAQYANTPITTTENARNPSAQPTANRGTVNPQTTSAAIPDGVVNQ
jgi:hypothetical protein